MAFTFTSDTLPTDHKAAIRQMKKQLREQLGDASVDFQSVERGHCQSRGGNQRPQSARLSGMACVVPDADIKAGRVSAEQREEIKRRGCAVIKGHFSREQAPRLG